MKSDMLQLLEDESTADLLLIVGDDKIEYKAHRLILSVRSEYFRKLFAMEKEKERERAILASIEKDNSGAGGRATTAAAGGGTTTTTTTLDGNNFLSGSAWKLSGLSVLPKTSNGLTILDLTCLDRK
jgi:hypothetical protein